MGVGSGLGICKITRVHPGGLQSLASLRFSALNREDPGSTGQVGCRGQKRGGRAGPRLCPEAQCPLGVHHGPGSGEPGPSEWARENVFHPPCGERVGSVGTRLQQETQSLAPRWGAVHAPHPQQKSGLSPRQQWVWWRGDHPYFPSLHVRGEAQPPGPPPSPILAWFRFIQIKQLSRA